MKLFKRKKKESEWLKGFMNAQKMYNTYELIICPFDIITGKQKELTHGDEKWILESLNDDYYIHANNHREFVNGFMDFVWNKTLRVAERGMK